MRRALAIGVAGALLAAPAACGRDSESEKVESLELELQADRSVLMAKPDNKGQGFGPDSEYVAVLRAGQKVVAHCYYRSAEMDDQVFVESDEGEGYMFILGRDGSEDQTPETLFDATIKDIKRQLRTCAAPDETACPEAGPINGIELEELRSDGSTSAVNTGECAAIYDPLTLQTVGQVASDQEFTVVCLSGPKPLAFEVRTQDAEGLINLDTNLIAELDQAGNFSTVPKCATNVAPQS